MTTLVEGMHAGEFIVSEANTGGTGVSRSRDAIKVANGQNLVAGAIIAILLAGTASASAGAGNTGDGVMGAITVSGSAQAGDYTLTIIETEAAAGSFTVEAPDGTALATGDVGAAYSDGGLAFTLADGATDFIAGDTFTITVTVTGETYAEYNPAGTNGSENVAGILFDAVDASTAEADGVALVRDCEFHADEVTWKTGMTVGEIADATAELKKLGILAR